MEKIEPELSSIDFKDVPLESPNIHIIIGMHREGKTVLMFSIADRLHQETGKPVYVGLEVNDLPVEKYGVPDYYHSWREFLPPVDSIFLTDDAHRRMHARRSMSTPNVQLDTYHGTMAHDDVDYLYDTQLLGSLDRNNFTRAWYRWYKTPYESESEVSGRSFFRAECGEARAALKGEPISTAYLRGEVYNGVVKNVPLPPYYNDGLSKMHRRRPEPWTRKLRRII